MPGRGCDSGEVRGVCQAGRLPLAVSPGSFSRGSGKGLLACQQAFGWAAWGLAVGSVGSGVMDGRTVNLWNKSAWQRDPSASGSPENPRPSRPSASGCGRLRAGGQSAGSLPLWCFSLSCGLNASSTRTGRVSAGLNCGFYRSCRLTARPRLRTQIPRTRGEPKPAGTPRVWGKGFQRNPDGAAFHSARMVCLSPSPVQKHTGGFSPGSPPSFAGEAGRSDRIRPSPMMQSSQGQTTSPLTVCLLSWKKGVRGSRLTLTGLLIAV